MANRVSHDEAIWAHLTPEWQSKLDLMTASGVPNTAFKRNIAKWLAVGAVERNLGHTGKNHVAKYRLLIPQEEGPPKIPRGPRISTEGSPKREVRDSLNILVNAQTHAQRLKDAIERLENDDNALQAKLVSARQSLQQWQSVIDAMTAISGDNP